MGIAELTSRLSYSKRLQVGAVIVNNNQIIATGYNGTPSGWDNTCEDIEWCRNHAWLNVDSDEIKEQFPNEGIYFDNNGKKVEGRYRLVTKPEVMHAESNALTKVARSTLSSEGATLFCTHSSCIECAKLIYQSGIKSVYYGIQYRDDSGLQFLRQSNIDVNKYPDSI